MGNDGLVKTELILLSLSAGQENRDLLNGLMRFICLGMDQAKRRRISIEMII